MHLHMPLLVRSVAQQASQAHCVKRAHNSTTERPHPPNTVPRWLGVRLSAACTGAGASCLGRTEKARASLRAPPDGRGRTGGRGAPANSASQTACRLACQERSGGPAAGASLAYDESAGTNSASGSGAPRAASVAVSGRSSRRGSRSCRRAGVPLGTAPVRSVERALGSTTCEGPGLYTLPSCVSANQGGRSSGRASLGASAEPGALLGCRQQRRRRITPWGYRQRSTTAVLQRCGPP